MSAEYEALVLRLGAAEAKLAVLERVTRPVLFRGWFDDFFGDQLFDEYETQVNNGSVALLDNVHGGWARLQANAGAGNWAKLWLGDQAGNFDTLDADEGWTQVARFALSASTADTMIIGAWDNGNERIWAGAFSGTWRLRCRTGAATTTDDSGIATDTDPHVHRLDVHRPDPAVNARQADYFLDGERIATVAINIPVNVITPVCYVWSNVAAVRHMDLDYWAVIPRVAV